MSDSGYGRSGILQDASSRSNMRSSSVPRRMSYAAPSHESGKPLYNPGGQGGNTTMTQGPDKISRRQLLEKWRRESKASRSGSPSPALSSASSVSNNGNNVLASSTPPLPPTDSSSSSLQHPSAYPGSTTKKRARFLDDPETTTSTSSIGGDQGGGGGIPPTAPAPPLPPSQGSSAVERYKLRRQQKQQEMLHQHGGGGSGGGRYNSSNDENMSPSVLYSSSPSAAPSPFSSGDDASGDFTVGAGGFTNTSRTSSSSKPSSLSRRLSVSGKAGRRRKTLSSAQMRNLSMQSTPSTPSKEVAPPDDSGAQTQENDMDVSTVEGAGLRSRLAVMQQRIEHLEKENLALKMSNAPKETRFRQKEDAWNKERARLFQEIEERTLSAKEADERCRSLENTMCELQTEKNRLELENRKVAHEANSSKQVAGQSEMWSRQLQNDRDVQELREKLRNSEEEVKGLRLERVSLESEVDATRKQLESLLRQYDELEEEYREVEAIRSQESDAGIQLEALTTEHIATAAQLNAVVSDLAETKSSNEAAMEEKEAKWKQEIGQLKFEISVLKTRGGNVDTNDEVATDVEDEAVLRARIEERETRISELEAELVRGEQLRRSMHNRIQELRGNIRVFVRTRPFLPGDGSCADSCIDVSRDGESVAIMDKGGKPQNFRFDKVFAPSAGQDSVFDEVSEFVQSALDGYHVCLFSYGQTGSGKTHTMQGSGNNAMRGIIPRAVEQILSQVNTMLGQKWTFSMSASFLEIYNEELRDLLTNMEGGNCTKSARGPNTRGRGSKLAIKRDARGKSYVDGLTRCTIDTVDPEKGMEQLEALMAVAARTRSVSSTKMNAQSSRSHSVFMLHLHGVNSESDTIVEGSLNLCDLAGSERLDRSGAASDSKTLKETQAINKSLSSLGDVFTALASRSKHVPFRNSKLTYLLQDCLSGDGKALMFVNLSPTVASSNESLCSLRFAQRVNQIELGKATKHVQYGGRR